MSETEDFSQRVRRYREKEDISQEELAKRLGISRNYVSMIEGGREPSDQVVSHFNLLETSPLVRDTPGEYRAGKTRKVQVLSWARAGHLGSYEELPEDWRDSITTDCPDPKSFALKIEGDSMEPFYKEGDVVVVMPSFKPYPDSLVVAKLKNGDVSFKIMSLLDASGEHLRLSSHNPSYGPRDVSVDDLEWIFPVYGFTRTTWNPQRWQAQFTERLENHPEAKPEY
jgi:phage repressor protein C with HTH and peptisase S24 domain